MERPHPWSLCQAQEDIQARPTPGISVTQQNKSMQQQSAAAASAEASGQRKRLVSTVDDFTDFV